MARVTLEIKEIGWDKFAKTAKKAIQNVDMLDKAGKRLQNNLQKIKVARLKNEFEKLSAALKKNGYDVNKTGADVKGLKRNLNLLSGSLKTTGISSAKFQARVAAANVELDKMRIRKAKARSAATVLRQSFNKLQNSMQKLQVAKLQKDLEKTRAAMLKAGYSVKEVNTYINIWGSSLKKTSHQLNVTGLKAQTFAQKVNPIKEALKGLNQQLRKTDQEMKKVSRSSSRLIAHFQRVAEVTRLIRGPLDGVAFRISKVGQLLGQITTAGGFWAGTMVAMSLAMAGLTAGIGSLIAATFNYARAMEPINRKMEVMIGSIEQAKDVMGELRRVSDLVGADFITTLNNFPNFAIAATGAGFRQHETLDLYKGVTEALANLEIHGPRAERVFLALEQMLSRTVLSMEEVRRQMGQAFPGAVSLFAKAAGYSVAQFTKLIENGRVLTIDVLPKAVELMKALGKEGGEAKKLEGINKELNRIKNSWTDVKEVLTYGLGLDQAYLKLLQYIAKAMVKITGSIKTMVNLYRQVVSEGEKDGLPALGEAIKRADVLRRDRARGKRDRLGSKPLKTDYVMLRDRQKALAPSAIKADELARFREKEAEKRRQANLKWLNRNEKKKTKTRVPKLSEDQKYLNKLLKEARSPLQVYQEELSKLDRIAEKFGVSQDIVAKKQQMLTDSFINADPYLRELSSGFKSLGRDMLQAFRNGDNMAKTFSNSLENLVWKMIELANEILIVEPLVRSLTQAFRGGSSSGGGDFFSSFLSSAFSGITGNLFGGASFSSSGPTNIVPSGFRGGGSIGPGTGGLYHDGGSFMTSGPNGRDRPVMLGLAGGERVDITPLRDKDKADDSGGGQVILNITTKGDETVNETQSGNRLDVMITQAVNRNIMTGGSTYNTISKTFNLRPGLNHRG